MGSLTPPSGGHLRDPFPREARHCKQPSARKEGYANLPRNTNVPGAGHSSPSYSHLHPLPAFTLATPPVAHQLPYLVKMRVFPQIGTNVPALRSR
jgi:hypothetical protein